MGQVISSVSWIFGGGGEPQPEAPPQPPVPEQTQAPAQAAPPQPTPAAQSAPAQPAKRVIDRSIFVQKDKHDETIVRVPGQINGNQFAAMKLTNCKVIVRDLVDSMTLDQCTGCDFLLCAVRGSIFARNCEKCRFIMVCGQFRCRDCSDCDFFMQVKTGPVIESSHDLRIGCAIVAYPELLDHMKRARLDPAVNIWNDIHDFTPEDAPHFELCPGKKLDLEINEITDDLHVFFTWGLGTGPHFDVTVSEDREADLARLSSSSLKLEATARSPDGIVCTVAAQSSQEAEAMFAELGPVQVKARE